MGDVGEMFNALKAERKARKEKRLAEADDCLWSKHTPYHWYMDTKIGRINYWPSTGLVMLKKQRMNIKGNRFQKLLERAEVNRDKGK